jgi:hypothetical protein
MPEQPTEFDKWYQKIFGFTPKVRVLRYAQAIVVIFSVLMASLVWERVRNKRKINHEQKEIAAIHRRRPERE